MLIVDFPADIFRKHLLTGHHITGALTLLITALGRKVPSLSIQKFLIKRRQRTNVFLNKTIPVYTTDTENGFSCSVTPKGDIVRPLSVCLVVLYKR